MQRFALILMFTGFALADGVQIVDSVVASVGRFPIKHSDVFREIRLTALQNRETPDFSAASQKEAVQRLIEQAIIREEVESGMVLPEDPDTTAQLLAQLQSLYGGESELQRVLEKSGLTREQLQTHLAWQTTVLRFIQMRFGRALESEPGAMNDAFFAWLEQTRQDRRIVIREERLK